MRVDAHQHFWTLARGDYDWLTPELTVLYRDHTPHDLEPLLAAHKIDATILVQAAPTIAETHYMLELAMQHKFIQGVVGWVDFESQDAASVITSLAKHPRLVGLRPMIQSIENTDWMLGANLTGAFTSLVEHKLVFDALTLPKHLPNLIQLLNRHPDMRMVIDHGSKPSIKTGSFQPWATDMALIANESEAYVKLSGLVTEASEDWSVDDLKPYVDHLISSFGPNRLIWGSDWPVCTLASSYEKWCNTTDTLLSDLDHADRSAILGGNAVQMYNLNGAR